MNLALEERPSRLPLSVACRALGLNRSSVYQRQKGLVGNDSTKRSRKNAPQPRALSEQECQGVLATLRSPEHSNQPPAEVHQRLLEQGDAPCSMPPACIGFCAREAKTVNDAIRRPAQHHAIPRLKATGPNQVWTWDIVRHEALLTAWQ
ncbi:hypothetical protein ACUNV4_30250 [Granulosicoccus sp. 3-233]|uniref:hypothetical protein n=1 Tax=Granulosicoccus sp. 3-233 TaxID=3417969 RepID=UPI003D34751D